MNFRDSSQTKMFCPTLYGCFFSLSQSPVSQITHYFPAPITLSIVPSELEIYVGPVCLLRVSLRAKRDSSEFVHNASTYYLPTAASLQVFVLTLLPGSPWVFIHPVPCWLTKKQVKERSVPTVIDSDNYPSTTFVSDMSSCPHCTVYHYLISETVCHFTVWVG